MPKPFKYWFADEVENTFEIKRQKTLPSLTDWISCSNLDFLTAEQMETVEYLRNELLDNVDAWNEEELKIFFIGSILKLIDFHFFIGDNLELRPFLNRVLQFEYKDEVYKGEVDFMIATGRQFPRKPYFFIHEYKQENKRDSDPLGQLLMGMMAARMNKNERTNEYGVYISRRNWFFVLLDTQNEYAVSNAYNATKEDIFQIVSILQNTKERIKQASLK